MSKVVQALRGKVAVATAVLATAGMLAVAPAAHANTYDFDGTSAYGVVDLVITTGTMFAPGEYDIATVTGTIDGISVSLLGGDPRMQTTSPDGQWFYDNVYYTTNPVFDLNGLLLAGLPGTEYNIYWSDGYLLGYSSGGSQVFPGDLITTTPLPTTWSLLMAGFVGLGYFAYRGSKKHSPSMAAAAA